MLLSGTSTSLAACPSGYTELSIGGYCVSNTPPPCAANEQQLNWPGSDVCVLNQSATPPANQPLSGSCAGADINGDGQINSLDSQQVAFRGGARLGDSNYNARYDLNNDGVINQDDLRIVSNCIGTSGPGGPANIPPAQLPNSPVAGFTPEGFIGQLISKILPIVLGLGGFATVIIIVISGIQFVTSSGNPEAAAAARSRLIFALIGFALIILAFAITQIINTIFLGSNAV